MGWRQIDLATHADLTNDTISRIEQGKVKAQPQTAKKIADALGVRVMDIVTDEPEEEYLETGEPLIEPDAQKLAG